MPAPKSTFFILTFKFFKSHNAMDCYKPQNYEK